MRVFKPNRSSAAAVAHPVRYALGVALMLLVVFVIIGLAQRHVWLGTLVGVCVAAAVFLLNYFTFREGGVGQRWFERNNTHNNEVSERHK